MAHRCQLTTQVMALYRQLPFEAIFTVGFAWEEDRMWYVLPKATADELDECPEHQRCGDCTLENGEACAARMAWDNTNPRRPQ